MCVLRARGRRPKTEHLEIILGVLRRFVAKKNLQTGYGRCGVVGRYRLHRDSATLGGCAYISHGGRNQFYPLIPIRPDDLCQ